MKYLVDSYWVADYLKGRNTALTFLGSLFLDGLAISIITYAEVYEGIYYGTDRRRHEEGFRDFLNAVPVLPLTRRIARRCATLRGRLQREGRILDQPDLFVAATAMHHNLVLVTRNQLHFERISDLQLY